MTLLHILILAVIQGLAELLPVSSSAHVIAVAKLMGIDPGKPEFTLMLVMLHTGTMFAVIVYFWNAWKRAFFSSKDAFWLFASRVVIASAVTGAIGLGLKFGIEHYMKKHGQEAEVENLFRHLDILAVALAAAGCLILWSGLKLKGREKHRQSAASTPTTPALLPQPPVALEYASSQPHSDIGLGDALAIGATQGFCIPFRGFSRSGATISVGLLRGMSRARLEEYSFALAVVITPPAVAMELHRVLKHSHDPGGAPIDWHTFTPSLLGMAFSFAAGLVALKLLSRLLEKGQWWGFGIYCLVISAGVYWMHLSGY